jgi:hypothetical protein
MTQNQTEKLERLHNRATRYELVMRNDKSGETLRLRYAMRANGRSLRSAVSDLAKELVAFTGAEEVIFTAGAYPSAQFGDWRLSFSGRTQRDAIKAGELRWFWEGR